MEAKRVGCWPDIDGEYGVEVCGEGLVDGAEAIYFHTEAAALVFIDRINRPSPSVPAPGPLSLEPRADGRRKLVVNVGGIELAHVVVGPNTADAIEAQLAIPAAIAALGPCPPWAEYGIVATGDALREHGDGWERLFGVEWIENPAVIVELLDRVEAAEAEKEATLLALDAACADAWSDGPGAAEHYLRRASERVS